MLEFLQDHPMKNWHWVELQLAEEEGLSLRTLLFFDYINQWLPTHVMNKLIRRKNKVNRRARFSIYTPRSQAQLLPCTAKVFPLMLQEQTLSPFLFQAHSWT